MRRSQVLHPLHSIGDEVFLGRCYLTQMKCVFFLARRLDFDSGLEFLNLPDEYTSAP
jgi:hypothetical protein